MKNILSLQEARQMLGMFKHPHFTKVENYVTVIETTPEWIKEILPPPLVPADPIVTITFSAGDQFKGTLVEAQARFGDKVGGFGIAYVMDSDLGVIFGREGLAEPKKLGITTVQRNGSEFVGTTSRYGQELVRVEATALQEGDPSNIGDIECFHFKYSIKPDGSGLEDVHLLNSSFKIKCTFFETLKPKKLELHKSDHDVYGNIPVKRVIACFHAKIDMVASAQYLADVDPEAFLPYAFWKHDDYRLTMTPVETELPPTVGAK
jgi:acetoacetate decarboxylase